MSRRGPKHGVRQRQTPAYDPDSNLPLWASVYLPADVAVKLLRALPSLKADPTGASLQRSAKLLPPAGPKAWRAAQACNLSLSGLLAELVRRMPVTADGRPAWQAPKSFNGLITDLVSRMTVDPATHVPTCFDSPEATLDLSLKQPEAA